MPPSHPDPAPSSRPSIVIPFGLALAIILAIAAAARYWEALRTPLWFDEIFTLEVAREGPRRMMQALAADMHPPLHYALEHLWIRIGGEGQLWLKSLSILTGLATVAALYGFAGALFGRGVGLAAALLLALHRYHVYYSQEARSYALLWLCYLLATWMAWRWVERARARDGALFVLAAVAALYTHYQSGLVLACLGLWGVIALARTPRRLAAWVGLNAVAGLLFAPQLPTMVAQYQRLSDEHWISPVSLAMLGNVFREYAFGVKLAVPILVALAIVPLLRARQRRAAFLVWMASLVPVLVAYAVSVRGTNMFTDRYMMFALPCWCALVVAGLAAVPGASLRRALAVGVIGVLALRSLLVHAPLAEAVALRQAEEWLRPRVRPGDVVVCADTHALLFLRYHAPGLGHRVLALAQPHLPYFEGAQFVSEPERVRLAAWDSLTAGARWYGVRAEHGGIDTRPALELMLSGAREVERFDRVTVVAGQ